MTVVKNAGEVVSRTSTITPAGPMVPSRRFADDSGCGLGGAEVGPHEAGGRLRVVAGVEVWLVDNEDANLDVARVLIDTASVIRDLRAEGKTVFLHCAYAQCRTPVVAFERRA